VRLTGRDGRPRTVLFANIAEAGYGGTVTDLANRLPRRVGAARYGIATVAAVARFRLVETTVRLDHHELTEPLSNVIVANGQFFGGGMKAARARCRGTVGSTSRRGPASRSTSCARLRRCARAPTPRDRTCASGTAPP
jgi:hypothetical protein